MGRLTLPFSARCVLFSTCCCLRSFTSSSRFLRPSSCFLTSNARFLRSAAIVSKFSCVAFEAVWNRLITMRWYITAAITSTKTIKILSNIQKPGCPELLPASSGVESRDEANGLFANLATLPPLNPSGHSQASLDLPIGLGTDRAMEAWYHPPLHEWPPTGGSHGKSHRTTKILSHARRRGGGVAARGARAAGRAGAAHRHPP